MQIWEIGGHNWGLEGFLLIILGADNVRSTEGYSKVLKCTFQVLKGHGDTRDARHPDAKQFLESWS